MSEFQEFPKIARLSRECIVTEKIDGTNASVVIADTLYPPDPAAIWQFRGGDDVWRAIYAGSRTRYVTREQDNHGFAKWVSDHAEELLTLGPGRHFGEWWGSGIQRGYGLQKGEKRFSLFNTSRWAWHGTEPQRIPTGDPRIEKYQDVSPACCSIVPVLYRGAFDTHEIEGALGVLEREGSQAAPGFDRPEGVIVYHVAANVFFKKTLENDAEFKGKVRA